MNASSESGLCAVRISRCGADISVRTLTSMAFCAGSKQTQGEERKWKKGGPSFFHRYSKNVVADHQPAQERAPRGGFSPTLAYPIVRHSSCCLPFGIRCDRPYPCPVLYVTSCHFKLRSGSWLRKSTGCFL